MLTVTALKALLLTKGPVPEISFSLSIVTTACRLKPPVAYEPDEESEAVAKL